MGDPCNDTGAVRSTGQHRKTSEKQEVAQRNCCADDPKLVGCLGRDRGNPQGKQGELTLGRWEESCWTEVELGKGEERCFCVCFVDFFFLGDSTQMFMLIGSILN